jgi:hypothetical protein
MYNQELMPHLETFQINQKYVIKTGDGSISAFV